MVVKNIIVKRTFRIAFEIAILAISMLAGHAGAVISISSCAVINMAGEYRLIADIPDSGASRCIEIISSDVIFDGDNYTIDGVDGRMTYGLYVYNSSAVLTNVTVKNLTVTDWYWGIFYQSVQNGTIKNTKTNSNERIGIGLGESTNNTLTENNASNNHLGIDILFSSHNNLTGNIANSNRYNGISLWYSINNTLTGNRASNNSNGIYFEASTNNNLTGSSVSNNSFGISIFNSSDYNDIEGNNASNNQVGILLNSTSQYHKFTNQTAWACSRCHYPHGGRIMPYRYPSENNTFTGNIAAFNIEYGISVDNSGNNTFYDNLFNNTNNASFRGTKRNNWNITKRSGINVVGGSNVSGNFWAHPTGSGFSQTCADADNDGLCDSQFMLDSSNIDFQPLKYRTAPPEVTFLSAIDGDGQTVSNNGFTTSNFITFIFNASTAVSGFECSLDGAGFVNCTSPKSYSIPAYGAHTFEVRAIDAADNAGNSEIFTWEYRSMSFIRKISNFVRMMIQQMVDLIRRIF